MNISTDQTVVIDAIMELAKYETQTLNLGDLTDYIRDLCEWDMLKAMGEVHKAATWFLETEEDMTFDAKTSSLIWAGWTASK